MRIAVTYENGEIFQHFGHTEAFKIYDVQDGKILCAKGGETIEITCDSVISSAGYIANPLSKKAKDVYLVGDCKEIGNLRTVVWGAYEAAMKI
jgi:2-enoate reductase